MAALDAVGQVAHGAGAGGHQMDVDAEPLAEHAAGIADAPVAVDRIADRDGMNELPAAVDVAVGLSVRAALDLAVTQRAAQVRVADLVARDGHLDADRARGRMPARQVDDDAADGLAGHLLGGVDRVHDRRLAVLHVDHGAVAHAAAGLLADTQNARPAGGVGRGNEAADLAAAHVQRGDQSLARSAQPGSHRSRLHPSVMVGTCVAVTYRAPCPCACPVPCAPPGGPAGAGRWR